jgi:predicted lysophospholipase L1 biosynthesis ABC-type transport system permease subunit
MGQFVWIAKHFKSRTGGKPWAWAAGFEPGFKAVAQRRVLDRELDEELGFHIYSYAGDLMRSGLARDEAMRRAHAELGSIVHEATFAIATRFPGRTVLPSLRDALRSVDASLPMLDVRTQDEQIAASLQHERIFANLTGGFGVLALVLACIGIYGIMAYAVSRRTNEIGIRMTLGAQPGRVLLMVLGEASWLAAAGMLVGLGAALALGRLVSSLLYGLKFWDPVTLVVAAMLLTTVAMTASWVPARRAAAVDPMRALRHE